MNQTTKNRATKNLNDFLEEMLMSNLSPEELDQLLIDATSIGNLYFLKLALALGANPEAQDNLPMINASGFDCPELIVLLHDAGGNVTARNNKCIKWSATRGLVENVAQFCRLGADPNEALLEAVKHNQPEVFECAIQYGAKITSEVVNLAIQFNSHKTLEIAIHKYQFPISKIDSKLLEKAKLAPYGSTYVNLIIAQAQAQFA